MQFKVTFGSKSSSSLGAELVRMSSQLTLDALSTSSSSAESFVGATIFQSCVSPSKLILSVRDDDEMRTAGFVLGFVSCFTAVGAVA